jgi:hypothetical protein
MSTQNTFTPPIWLIAVVFFMLGILTVFMIDRGRCCNPCGDHNGHPPHYDISTNNLTSSLQGCSGDLVYNDDNGVMSDEPQANILKARFKTQFGSCAAHLDSGGTINKCLLANLLESLGPQTEVGYYFGYTGKHIVLMFKGGHSPGAPQNLGSVANWFLRTGDRGFCPERCP